ncbi:MAG: hypothetical protein RSA41_07045 [Christensenella sp.]
MNTRSTTQLRFDETLHAKAKIIADRELRTLNAQLEYFIKTGVNEYEKTHGVIILSEND